MNPTPPVSPPAAVVPSFSPTFLSPRYVVGVASSAGGLEALRQFLGAFPEPPPAAFLVAQHLRPHHESRMVELLQSATTLHVVTATEGAVPEAGTVYVTPPNKDLELVHGRLKLSEPGEEIGPKPSGNRLFRSIARECGKRAVAIVLSGTGSDGALGLASVKEAGGFTFCQALPSAKFNGMPSAARRSGQVDWEVDLKTMAVMILDLDRHTAEPSSDDDPYRDILKLVETSSGNSFDDYKEATVRRRIVRRMIAQRLETPEAYLEHLKTDPEEAKTLAQEILISVTAFFRDRPAWKSLEKAVAERVRQKPEGSTFRVWSVGCATGEEAYSLEILVNETLRRLKKRMAVQIFATDLDEEALPVARRGTYAKRAVTLPPTTIARYFVESEDNYRVNGMLRENVIFAKHNVVQDPPFVNIDLASCRNVLIYFNSPLQQRAFRNLHYALGEGGLLFLGRSETVPGLLADCFPVLDKKNRIYRRTGPALKTDVLIRDVRDTIIPILAKKNSAGTGPESVWFSAMVRGLAPDSLIVDAELRVIHTFGRAAEYLSFPAGQTSTTASKLLPRDLGSELELLVREAHRRKGAYAGRAHEIGRGKKKSQLRLRAVPLEEGAHANTLVAFDFLESSAKAASKVATGDRARHRQLERELELSREQIQALLADRQSTREELETLNEELQSTNEELQSSNEELETANEELQSSNEELTTVNEELNTKTSELMVMNQQQLAVQNAIVYPILIVDRKMKLLNANPAARQVFRLAERDRGLPLSEVTAASELKGILDQTRLSLESGEECRWAWTLRDRSYDVQVQLFREESGRADGAVISLVDNTEILSTLEEARIVKERLSSILDHTPAVVTMKDLSGVYLYANPRFSELASERGTVVGKTDEELFGASTAAQIRARDFQAIALEKPLNFEETIAFGDRSYVWTSAKVPLFDRRRRPYCVCTISLDITDRLERERRLEVFRRAIATSTSGTVVFAKQGDDFVATFVSDHLLPLLGAATEEELVGRRLEELVEKLHPKNGSTSFLAELRDPASSSVTVNVGREMEDRWLEIRTAVTQEGGAATTHVIWSVFDVTPRVQDQRTIAMQQDELTRFGRFAILGEIAAGIAHEINTPLNVITSHSDILRRSAELGRLDKTRLTKIAVDIDRMAKTISSVVVGLKAAVGFGQQSYEVVAVDRLVQDALKICEYRLQRFGVAVEWKGCDSDLRVDCVRVQVVQILINLVNNAVDAVAVLKQRWIRIEASHRGPKVEILVTDSGHGIGPELAEKIMTPFFSTKNAAHGESGTGVGLSLSRSIARRHDGDLSVVLGEPHTTFRLELAKSPKRTASWASD